MSKSLLFLHKELMAAITQTISELVEKKGIECPFNSSESVIDLRDFSLCASDENKRMELLLDSCQVCYINEEMAYNSEGLIFSISTFLEKNNQEDICSALDIISEN